MYDLYAENYKTVMKEVKEPIKWRHRQCLWLGRLNIGKVSILFLFEIYHSQNLSSGFWFMLTNCF